MSQTELAVGKRGGAFVRGGTEQLDASAVLNDNRVRVGSYDLALDGVGLPARYENVTARLSAQDIAAVVGSVAKQYDDDPGLKGAILGLGLPVIAATDQHYTEEEEQFEVYLRRVPYGIPPHGYREKGGTPPFAVAVVGVTALLAGGAALALANEAHASGKSVDHPTLPADACLLTSFGDSPLGYPIALGLKTFPVVTVNKDGKELHRSDRQIITGLVLGVDRGDLAQSLDKQVSGSDQLPVFAAVSVPTRIDGWLGSPTPDGTFEYHDDKGQLVATVRCAWVDEVDGAQLSFRDIDGERHAVYQRDGEQVAQFPMTVRAGEDGQGDQGYRDFVAKGSKLAAAAMDALANGFRKYRGGGGIATPEPVPTPPAPVPSSTPEPPQPEKKTSPAPAATPAPEPVPTPPTPEPSSTPEPPQPEKKVSPAPTATPGAQTEVRRPEPEPVPTPVIPDVQGTELSSTPVPDQPVAVVKPAPTATPGTPARTQRAEPVVYRPPKSNTSARSAPKTTTPIYARPTITPHPTPPPEPEVPPPPDLSQIAKEQKSLPDEVVYSLRAAQLANALELNVGGYNPNSGLINSETAVIVDDLGQRLATLVPGDELVLSQGIQGEIVFQNEGGLLVRFEGGNSDEDHGEGWLSEGGTVIFLVAGQNDGERVVLVESGDKIINIAPGIARAQAEREHGDSQATIVVSEEPNLPGASAIVGESDVLSKGVLQISEPLNDFTFLNLDSEVGHCQLEEGTILVVTNQTENYLLIRQAFQDEVGEVRLGEVMIVNKTDLFPGGKPAVALAEGDLASELSTLFQGRSDSTIVAVRDGGEIRFVDLLTREHRLIGGSDQGGTSFIQVKDDDGRWQTFEVAGDFFEKEVGGVDGAGVDADGVGLVDAGASSAKNQDVDGDGIIDQNENAVSGLDQTYIIKSADTVETLYRELGENFIATIGANQVRVDHQLWPGSEVQVVEASRNESVDLIGNINISDEFSPEDAEYIEGVIESYDIVFNQLWPELDLYHGLVDTFEDLGPIGIYLIDPSNPEHAHLDSRAHFVYPGDPVLPYGIYLSQEAIDLHKEIGGDLEIPHELMHGANYLRDLDGNFIDSPDDNGKTRSQQSVAFHAFVAARWLAENESNSVSSNTQ